jgi:formylglycine-generating enzyme required for sulfatase activity
MRFRIRLQLLLLAVLAAASCQLLVGLDEGHFIEDTGSESDMDLDTPDDRAEPEGTDDGEEPDGAGDPDGEDGDAPEDTPAEEATDPCGGSCGAGRACDEATAVCVPEACARSVAVPAGELFMGTDEAAAPADRKPEHQVEVSAFSIDACEVTNDQYRACVEASVCSRPDSNRSSTRAHYYDREEYDDYPVLEVTWDDARTFCEWAGKRLPTEAEWEKAARGGCELGTDPAACDDGDHGTWPWGDEAPTCTLAHYDGCTPADTTVCGSLPDGASPYGALDMAGNVAEWVSDWFDAAYYAGAGPWTDPAGPETGSQRSVRGGAFNSIGDDIAVTARSSANPPAHENDIGFRCAASP